MPKYEVPSASLEFKGNYKHLCIFDTGTTRSLISEKTADKFLDLDIAKLDLDFDKSEYSLRGANGSALIITG